MWGYANSLRLDADINRKNNEIISVISKQVVSFQRLRTENMKSIDKSIVKEIKLILEEARKNVVRNVNKTIASTYFEIGRLLVNEHQKGNKRAAYGEELTKD